MLCPPTTPETGSARVVPALVVCTLPRFCTKEIAAQLGMAAAQTRIALANDTAHALSNERWTPWVATPRERIGNIIAPPLVPLMVGLANRSTSRP